MSTSASSVCRRLVHGSMAVAVAAAVVQALPASAAPSSPEITAPTGANGPSIEIAWAPSATATAYEVQVDNDPTFGSPEWSIATVNTASVPTRMFTAGSQFVRVRAKDSTNAWSDWTSSSFTVTDLAGPSLTSPADGATLAQPHEPSVLTWTPVQGASSYTVEIDTEDGFVDAATTTTKANSFVVTSNQAPYVGYYWRVRANLSDGVATDYSATRSFDVEPIGTPTITGPSNDEDITDVVLDWDPVPGAQYYELEVDDDFDFSSKLTGIPARVLGTRFSPKTTFGNDQYFWRVRARDLDDNPTEWVRLNPEEHYAFDRVWRDVPQPVHPAGPGTQRVGNDLFYEWTPVEHASHYEVWLSTDPNFTHPSNPIVTWQCQVAGTTYTPGELGDACMPGSEGTTYYWKVRPMDAPYTELGIFSPVQRFVYTGQDGIDVTSPAPGATVHVPTLDWEPVPETAQYEVSLYNRNNLRLIQAKTYSTSYTATSQLSAADGPYTWRLRALDAGNRTSMDYAVRTFDMSTDPIPTGAPLELSNGAPTYDAPGLSWGAMENAAYYRVRIGDATTGTWFASSSAPITNGLHFYPAATDTSTKYLADGSYVWQVTAHKLDGSQLAASTIGEFEVKSLGPVTGQRLALTGSAIADGDVCDETLTSGPNGLCDGLPATPVLDWSSVPYAASYRVHLSRDGDFTSGALTSAAPDTTNTLWTPRWGYVQKALQDSQAQTPYYWFIQPCKTPSICGPDPRSTVNPARHAFRKASPAVELLTPAHNLTVADDLDTTEITFTWRDYFDTNQDTTYAPTAERSYQSAKSYEIQLSLQPTFSTFLESAIVDQPTYTSADKLYPEGPVYWRVQAIDANDNRLGWSDVRKFVKTSPRPELTSPLTPDGGPVLVAHGAVPFSWKATAFASSYDIQVAANDDLNFSATNLRVNKSTKRAAYATGVGGVPTLQASEVPYVWRVRRVDAASNPGPWSATGRFLVSLPAPTQLSPEPAALMGPRGVVLRWDAQAMAAKYRVEYRKVGATVTTVTTPSPAFAPVTALVPGSSYEWRVSSVDIDNRVSAPGPWRTFTIGGPPSASVAARIEGSGVFETELTAVSPTWTVPGVDETYVWRRNGQPIAGATAATYRVAAADVGSSITVVVTGSSAEFGSGASTSAAVAGKPGTGPVARTSTVVAGSGQVGSTLTSILPEWDLSGTVPTLQWRRNGSTITGATGATYTVVPGDLNAAITLEVTGTVTGRTPTVAVSNAITAVQGRAATASSPPSIHGNPKVGTTLTSTAPTWDQGGVQNLTQWMRDDQPISGATTATYTVGAADVDAAITVRYTGRLQGRADGVVTSAPVTGVLGDAPVVVSSPTVAGTAKVGRSLTATAPTWSLNGVQNLVQWLRDGQPIAGATTTTYAVRAEDVDASIAVRFTGRLAGRIDGSVTSGEMTGMLGDAPTTPALPAPSGTGKVGTTLTAPPATWTPADVQQSYQWLRDGQPIAGEVGMTYVVPAGDVDKSIAVRITATAPGRPSGEATSRAVVATAAPTPPPTTPTTPTVPTVPTPTQPSPTQPTPTPTQPTPTQPTPQSVASRTALSAPKKVAAGKRATVTVKVTAAGTVPTGVVKLYAGKKLVGTVALAASAKGVAKVRLAKLGKGRYQLRAVYAGAAAVSGSSSGKVTLVVR